MRNKPLLQLYSDGTWGYDVWDEDRKEREGVEVQFQQEREESREDFFERICCKPPYKAYGSDLYLDELCNNGDASDLEEAIDAEYGFEKLIHSKDWHICFELAKKGCGLETLATHEHWVIRAEVARQGHGLDLLYKDAYPIIRRNVACFGRKLDVLVYDKNPIVRAAVAEQGYGLNLLAEDKDPTVKEAAEHYLKSENFSSVDEWAKKNPEKVAKRKAIDFSVSEDRLKKLKEEFSKTYELLYDRKMGYSTQDVTLGDNLLRDKNPLMFEFISYRQDILSSDRELAAFVVAARSLGFLKR